MAQTDYPDASALAAFLEAQGITAPSSSQCDIYIDSAIEDFELQTHYKPFYNGDHESSDVFCDPPINEYILNLPCGFLTITAIRTEVYGGSAGTLLTEGTHYHLDPYNLALDGGPYRRVIFLTSPGFEPKSVKISGIIGYTATMPQKVYLAILQQAASQLILEAIQGVSTLSAIEQGAVKLRFDNEEGRSKIDRWQSNFKEQVMAYKRIHVAS